MLTCSSGTSRTRKPDRSRQRQHMSKTASLNEQKQNQSVPGANNDPSDKWTGKLITAFGCLYFRRGSPPFGGKTMLPARRRRQAKTRDDLKQQDQAAVSI
jgi:hypothetical protein